MEEGEFSEAREDLVSFILNHTQACPIRKAVLEKCRQ
jgi:hypothetical protein